MWKGLADRPFIVSTGREVDAVARLRTQSL
jgi:hypothetical protein